jgi:hypothetical protein
MKWNGPWGKWALTWADVFRRIGLDWRDHMNSSYAFAGRPERIVRYDGMPMSNYPP